MASLIRDRNSRKRIQLIHPVTGDRRTIRLGKTPMRTAEAIKIRIEALASHLAGGTPPDPEVTKWTREISDELHGRLARAGLVEPRESREAASTLGDLLDRFVNSKSVARSTADAYRQTTNSLREHFGEDRRIDSISTADADGWRKAIADSGLAPATVAKRTHVAKSVFRTAVRWELIAKSPFDHLKAGSQSNADRNFYVARETIERVIEAAPDTEWRTMIALSRYAGLRCPSEVCLLRWSDVNWERGRLMVRSPKTAGHGGEHAVRVVPIGPELRPILLEHFEQVEPGTVNVVQHYRSSSNTNPHFRRIVVRAGEKPWPRLFHNLRASCLTDWAERFPAHAVAKWAGHSPLIAATHYLTTRDSHFAEAAGLDGTRDSESGAQSGARAAREPTRAQHARNREDSRVSGRDDSERAAGAGVMRAGEEQCETILPGADNRECVTNGRNRTRTCDLRGVDATL